MPIYQDLNKKPLNPKLAGAVLGILIIGMIFLVSQEFISLKKELNNLKLAETAEKITRQVAQEKVQYTIDFGGENVKSYRITPSKTSTVFSLLEKLAERENFKVESKIYKDMGVFVESIDGVKNGTDNKYWQYWVNGELPMVAADKKEVKKGDRVEWKFAPSPF